MEDGWEGSRSSSCYGPASLRKSSFRNPPFPEARKPFIAGGAETGFRRLDFISFLNARELLGEGC